MRQPDTARRTVTVRPSSIARRWLSFAAPSLPRTCGGPDSMSLRVSSPCGLLKAVFGSSVVRTARCPLAPAKRSAAGLAINIFRCVGRGRGSPGRSEAERRGPPSSSQVQSQIPGASGQQRGSGGGQLIVDHPVDHPPMAPAPRARSSIAGPPAPVEAVEHVVRDWLGDYAPTTW
jgi:hypothetical protein